MIEPEGDGCGNGDSGRGGAGQLFEADVAPVFELAFRMASPGDSDEAEGRLYRTEAHQELIAAFAQLDAALNGQDWAHSGPTATK